jgi:hypothetical protein
MRFDNKKTNTVSELPRGIHVDSNPLWSSKQSFCMLSTELPEKFLARRGIKLCEHCGPSYFSCVFRTPQAFASHESKDHLPSDIQTLITVLNRKKMCVSSELAERLRDEQTASREESISKDESPWTEQELLKGLTSFVECYFSFAINSSLQIRRLGFISIQLRLRKLLQTLSRHFREAKVHSNAFYKCLFWEFRFTFTRIHDFLCLEARV